MLLRDPEREQLTLTQQLGLDIEDLPPVPLPQALVDLFLQTEEPRPFRVDEELAAAWLRRAAQLMPAEAAPLLVLARLHEQRGEVVVGGDQQPRLDLAEALDHAVDAEVG